MQKQTMLCVLLTMTLVVAVKAQVNVDCLNLFSEAVEGLATTDQACATTLRQVTSESTECTDDIKNAIDKCLHDNEAFWNSFNEACETVTAQTAPATPTSNQTNVTTSPSPSVVPPASPTIELNISFAEAPVPEPLFEPVIELASVPAPEPEVSEWDMPMWQPETAWESDSAIEESENYPETEPTSTPASSPEAWSPEPTEEVEEPEEEISVAPEPVSARRLSRRLLSEALEEEDESDFVQLKRTLLQTANPTCRDLFIQGGADAFHNNAASLKLSLLSIIGSILLGLMLI